MVSGTIAARGSSGQIVPADQATEPSAVYPAYQPNEHLIDDVNTSDAVQPTNGEVAVWLAQHGWYVVPACTPTVDGECGCKPPPGTWRRHTGKQVGKEPQHWLARVKTASGVPAASNGKPVNDPDVVRELWAKDPHANVAVVLAPSNLIAVDCDNDAGVRWAGDRGVVGGIVRTSRQPAYLFRRPDGVPATSNRKPVKDAAIHLEILASENVIQVVHGRHRFGHEIRLVSTRANDWRPNLTQLVDAPTWVVDAIRERAAEKVAVTHQVAESDGFPPAHLSGRGLAFWTGADALLRNDQVDWSRTMQALALEMAKAGWRPGLIADSLAERDQALGYAKYVGRPLEYHRAAHKAYANRPAEPDDLAGMSRHDLVQLVLASRAHLTATPPTVAPADQHRIIARHEQARIGITSRPRDELSASGKLVIPAVVNELVSGISRLKKPDDPVPMPIKAIADQVGLSRDVVGKAIKRFAGPAASGAPWDRFTVNRSVVEADGRRVPRKQTLLVPHARTRHELLQLIATYTPPPIERERRLTRCPHHPTADVTVEVTCSDCGHLLGRKTGQLPANRAAHQPDLVLDGR